MNSMKKITFVGSGINGSSLKNAILNSSKDSRLGPKPPIGATWPFVRLSIGGGSVEFRMPYIHKTVLPPDVNISLGKLGYFYFRTNDRAGDFGFATFSVYTLIQELTKRGYRLDESCQRNARRAKIIMFATTGVGGLGLIAGTILLILA
jgi:hypothetical protein